MDIKSAMVLQQSDMLQQCQQPALRTLYLIPINLGNGISWRYVESHGLPTVFQKYTLFYNLICPAVAGYHAKKVHKSYTVKGFTHSRLGY